VGVDEEFQTVDLLINSSAETRGVDAFSLTVIKAERQIRKLFTYLVFQFPCFSRSAVRDFRNTLTQNRRVYFDGFIKGIDTLYPRSIQDMIGPDFETLYADLKKAIEYRNKIFHGQLTNRYLERLDLLEMASSNRRWCIDLAQVAQAEFGYDGFDRNSLRKAPSPIWQRYKVHLSCLDDYRDFIHSNMEYREPR
jgi:hypothetical protein